MKRGFDAIASVLGLIVLSPALLIVAIWILIDDPGPVFFRQVRIGRFGKPFRIWKFRTMFSRRDATLELTVGADPRITKAGRLLRKYKLDELPQLINVAVGEMSLVGPRPEVPKYVAHYPAGVRECVLAMRPGITDLASLEFLDENEILGKASDPERTYIETILPLKLGHYVSYARERSFIRDLRILFLTFAKIIR